MFKILGAGISGLTSAINLAKNGEDVIVYEKRPKVGMKMKPNFQLFGNWDTSDDIIDHLKSFGVDINYQTKLDRIIFYSPNLKHTAQLYSSSRPVGYTVIRGGKNSLECYLAKQAKKLGVKIITNFNKRIKADIIAAGSKRLDGVGYGSIFKGRFDKKTAIVLFDYNYAPGGYAYILPHSKRIATVAIAMRPWDNPQNMFQKLISEHKIFKEHLVNSKLLYNFSGFINFSIPNTAIEGNSLLVGEAAGFQDAAFGFGMRYAIYSGYLASKSILERKNYDELWKKAFLHELKKTLKIRYVLEKIGNNFLNRLIKNIGERDIEEFTNIWNSERRLALFFIKSLFY
ncbi:MAG: NAD(P)/FAD-dependent oxidoreductase [Candidatus Nanoarchaeia archaeon]